MQAGSPGHREPAHMKFDLHLHTTRHSPDSRMDPFALCRRAETIGLDGFVITEHDWLWTETELDELRRGHPRLVILAGIEVRSEERRVGKECQTGCWTAPC